MHRFKKGASLSHLIFIVTCFITGDDAHNLYVFSLGEEHAQLALKGAGCAYCDRFTVRKLFSCLALFVGDGSWADAPQSLGPAAPEASHQLVVGVADGVHRGDRYGHVPFSGFTH